MFKPEQLKPIPPFSWQAVDDTPNIIAYRHSYQLDKVLTINGVYHCFGLREEQGFSLLSQAFIHPENQHTLFLLHGYTDHVGLYQHLIYTLLQAGINVVGIDLPGHGLSSGERTGIQSFAVYQQVIRPIIDDAMRALPGTWSLLGHSTGGAIAMDYIMNTPKHGFQQLILLAPLIIPSQWTWVKIRLFLLRPFLQRVPRFFSHNSTNLDFLHFIRQKDPLQSRSIGTSWVQSLYDWQSHFEQSSANDIHSLLIQGEQDNVVEWRYNRTQVERKFPNLQEFFIKDAKHHLANETPAIRNKVFQQILTFLNQQALEQ